MNYWLMKTEPETFSWQDLVRDGKACWDGVRNYQARNNIQAMKEGDLVFIYHSVSDKEIVGIAKVNREAYPDPTTEDERWKALDVIPFQALDKPVSLAKIKKTEGLENIYLLKQSRLSVMPLKPEEFDIILALAQNS
jgi:predicted RNA-binding protein with PUA-like domain